MIVLAMNYKRAAIALLLLFLQVGCGEKAIAPIKLTGFTMGTSYHITVVPGDVVVTPMDLQQKVDALLVTLNQSMSTYIEDSELSALNKAPVGEAVSVSPELFDVLLLSSQVSWRSGGAFDITVGPLVNIWGFGPSKAVDEPPQDTAVVAQLENVGYENVSLNLANNTVTKKKAVTLDLSAVAKGFAVDQVAQLLAGEKLRHFMVEIGGELWLSGFNPDGKSWRIAIEQPDSLPGTVYKAIAVSDKGVATSGDYRNYFVKDGKRFSHTIDPRTGYPINHSLASVTVVADTTAEADALATAINVMGAEAGMKLAEQEGLAVYLISHDGAQFVASHSRAFDEYLR